MYHGHQSRLVSINYLLEFWKRDVQHVGGIRRVLFVLDQISPKSIGEITVKGREMISLFICPREQVVKIVFIKSSRDDTGLFWKIHRM
jgi:hypothetical protein